MTGIVLLTININMKKSIAVLGFSIVCLGGFAQQKEEAAPKMFKVDAVQKINASVYQLVHNPVSKSVYVVGPKGGFRAETDQFVYVLDDATLAVKDSINIGKYTPFGLAINTKTQTLYVGHSIQQNISAVDLKTRKSTLIPSGREKSKIREIVVDEDRNLVYVSDHGDPSIWVVDGKTNKYLKTIAIPGTFPLGLSVDSRKGRIYTTDSGTMQGNVLVYDSKTNELVGKWKTWSYCPLNIALDLKNNRLFVSQSNDNNITVLDAGSGEIIDKVYLGYDASPIGLVYDEKSGLLFTANREKKEVAVIDTETYKVKERVPTEGLANTIVLDKNTGAVYVTNKSPRKADDAIKKGDTVQKIVRI